MAGFVGMDIDAVRALATQMNNNADQIQNLMNTMTTQLQNTNWVGPDREKFLGDWQSTHVSQLNNVITGLQQASQDAQRNAGEQETASI